MDSKSSPYWDRYISSREMNDRRIKAELAAAADVAAPTNLAAISADLLATKSASDPEERRVICDESLTEQIRMHKAELTKIYTSSARLGEGSYGFTTSANITAKGLTGPTINCIAAIKTAKFTRDELEPDVVMEIGAYTRLQTKPCLAKGLFMKFRGKEVLSVMEHYVTDLATLTKLILNEYRAPSEEFLKAIMFQVSTGLKGMHDECMIHRDLKPANVLLGHNGYIFVADYGLSLHNPIGFLNPQSFYSPSTTPLIRPPETEKSGKFESRFDIWGLGCTMVYLITGDWGFKKAVNASKNSMIKTYDLDRDAILNKVKGYRYIRSLREGELPIYSNEAISYLEALLTVGPQRRPTIQEVLENPWFKDMTLSKSRKIIQSILKNTVDVPTISKTLVAARKLVRTATHRRGSDKANIRQMTQKIKQGAMNYRNIHTDAYFPLRDSVSAGTEWKPFLETREVNRFNRIFGISWYFAMIGKNKRTPIIGLLHAIELHDRFMNKVGNQFRLTVGNEYNALLYACFMVAIKLNDYQSYMNPPAAAEFGPPLINPRATRGSTEFGTIRNKIIEYEKMIIRELYGDILIQKKGFVRTFVDDFLLLKDDIQKKETLSARFALGLLLYASVDPTAHSLESILEYAEGIRTKKIPNLTRIQKDLDATWSDSRYPLILYPFFTIIAAMDGDIIGTLGVTGQSPFKQGLESIEYAMKTRLPNF